MYANKVYKASLMLKFIVILNKALLSIMNHWEQTKLEFSLNSTTFFCSEKKCIQFTKMNHSVLKINVKTLLNFFGKKILHAHNCSLHFTWWVFCFHSWSLFWFISQYDKFTYENSSMLIILGELYHSYFVFVPATFSTFTISNSSDMSWKLGARDKIQSSSVFFLGLFKETSSLLVAIVPDTRYLNEWKG